MNIFEQIGSAPATGGGNYLDRLGQYRLRLKKAYMKKGHKGESLITEWLVMSARQVDPKEEPCPEGSTRSMVFNFKNEMAASNVKAMLLGMFGYEETQVQPGQVAQIAEKLVHPSNPFRGFEVAVETYEKTAKQSGKRLVLPKWEHVPQTQEDIKRQAAELDVLENRTPSEASASSSAPVPVPPPSSPTPPTHSPESAPTSGSLLAQLGIK